MPSVLRVIAEDSCAIGCASVNAKTTTTIPISMVVGMLSWDSVSQRTSSRTTRRCRIHGSRITLSPSDKAADA